MSGFWLYLGIILACSGVGTIPGIIIIVMYFYNDVKKIILRNNFEENQNHQHSNPKYFDQDTAEKMR